MKKLLLTLATLALLAPLSACSKGGAEGGNNNPPQTSEAAPTAADLITNTQIMYGEYADAVTIDGEHLELTLPAMEGYVKLSTRISVKNEADPRNVASSFALVGEYDAEKVLLNEDEGSFYLLVKAETSFTLKTSFHFADTDEDIEKEYTITTKIPSRCAIVASRSNEGNRVNYGTNFSTTNGIPETVSDEISLCEMSNSGSYGYGWFNAEVATVRKVIIKFNRVGVFSSVKVWGSLDKTTYVEKTGDIGINKTRSDLTANNEVVVDFSSVQTQFAPGSPYYVKLWFWNSTEYSEETSLIDSILVMYTPFRG